MQLKIFSKNMLTLIVVFDMMYLSVIQELILLDTYLTLINVKKRGFKNEIRRNYQRS